MSPIQGCVSRVIGCKDREKDGSNVCLQQKKDSLRKRFIFVPLSLIV